MVFFDFLLIVWVFLYYKEIIEKSYYWLKLIISNSNIRKLEHLSKFVSSILLQQQLDHGRIRLWFTTFSQRGFSQSCHICSVIYGLLLSPTYNDIRLLLKVLLRRNISISIYYTKTNPLIIFLNLLCLLFLTNFIVY